MSDFRVEIATGQNLNAFHELAINSGLVFFKPEFLGIYGNRLLRCIIRSSNNEIQGIFVVYLGGKWGLKTLITPPYAPTIPFATVGDFSDRHQRACMLALASFLTRSSSVYYHIRLSPLFNDLEPFVWLNADISEKHTRILDLSLSEESLLKNCRPTSRQKIQQGLERQFDYRQPSADELFLFFSKWIPGKRNQIHLSIIRGLIDLSERNESVFISSVVDDDGNLMAANLVCYDASRAYLLLSAKTANALPYAQRTAIWNSIRKCKAMNIPIWDFEGSSIPGVDDFFKSFGATKQHFSQISGGYAALRYLLRKRR